MVHRLIATSCASRVGMYFDMAGIDHQPFKVCVIHQGFQDPFPDSLVTPPAKPAVYLLPVSVRFWQVPPRCPGTKDPEYTVDKLPGITGISSACPFSPMVYGLIFSHALSLISCRCCSIAVFLPSFTFEDHYISLLLTTLSRPSGYFLSNHVILSALKIFSKSGRFVGRERQRRCLSSGRSVVPFQIERGNV